MKKLALILTFLLLSLTNIVAQDTIYHIENISFSIFPQNTVSDSNIQTIYGYGIFDEIDTNNQAPFINNNGCITFSIDGLDTNMVFILYINKYMYSEYIDDWDVSIWFDSVENEIIKDSTPILKPIFTNGYNVFELDSIDTIYCISMSIAWIGDTIDTIYTITSSDINILNNNNELDIEYSDISDISIHPNPTTGIVYINGDYNKLTINDNMGNLIVDIPTKVSIIDMKRLKNGVYYFVFDQKMPIKIIKQ